MKEIYQEMKKAAREGKPLALATIVMQKGAAPRAIGAKCLIGENGLMAGTVGGGMLEAKTLREANNVLASFKPAKVSFVLKGKDVEKSDMLCGGEAEIFIEPVYYEVHLRIFERAANIEKRGGKAALATVLNVDLWKDHEVPKLLVTKEGEKVGGADVFPETWATLDTSLREVMESRKAAKMVLGDGIEVFVEPVVSNPVLYIFGGGHVSRQIVPLAAKVGFNVVVVDDREEFTRPEDLPGAAQIHQMPFDDVISKLNVDEDSYIVIVTRGHIHDKNVLGQALKTNAKYIGMIGSKRKRNMVYQKLLEEGFNRDDLKKVHSPIGLDIGAETPEEIAVSIVAELVKVRAGRE